MSVTVVGDSLTTYCRTCGTLLSNGSGATRSGPRPQYCSNACRQRAYRLRLAAQSARAAGGEQSGASDRVKSRAVTAVPDPEPTRRPVRPPAPQPDPNAGTRRPNPTQGNVPAAADSLIGRQDELVELGQLVDAHRMVTVVGPPGVGKSRLALDVARQAGAGLLDCAWPDGVWLVDCAPLNAGVSVVTAITSALSLPTWCASVPGLVEVLRSRRILLVLDNVEHVLAGCTEIANALIRACAGVRVLATSREPLDVNGAALLPLGPLSTGARPDRPQAGVDAVRLFVERAAASVPHLDLTGQQHAATVARLCTRLDGLPLAIELAARCVRLLGIDDLLAHVDAGHDLVGGNRSGSRHGSLRGALDVSYRLLSTDEQLVFRRLSVLADPVDAESVQALCPESSLTRERIAAVLAGLANRSLLLPADRPGAPSYDQFRTVRGFGQYRLRLSGEADDTYRRLAGWLAGLAQPELDQARPSERLRPHLRTLRVVVAWSAHHRDPRSGELAAALALCLQAGGRLAEAGAVARQAVRRSDRGGAYRGILLTVAASVARWHGDTERMAAEAAEAAAEPGMPEVRAGALALLGLALVDRGDLEPGKAALTKAMHLGRPMSEPLVTARAAHGMGRALLVAARTGAEVGLESAETELSAAEEELRRAGEAAELCAVLLTTAEVALAREQPDVAEQRLIEALRCVRTQPELMPAPLDGLALVALRRGQADRGLRLIAAADGIRVRTGAARPVVGPLSRWPELDDADAGARRSFTSKQLADLHTAAIQMTPDQLLAFAAGAEWSELVNRTENRRRERERRVVELVAQGLTNPQIARRTGVSERTVVTDVRRICRRVGVRSRSELAALAAKRPLVQG
ncbi:MAG TPA: LuxR C-terminal-related transcriptional regulator [Pseudonocardiaceae bacterium]|jgi:predicted ATPase/DNA-binding CsgD family transcriptional regulator|nr:LuxR C-terminal-related transcriptional regulator [Pseudonocardiaceae bacterium]